MDETERQLKEEKLRRHKEEKYRYYVPIGKVEEFCDVLFSGKYLTGLLSAANGVGKTTAMVNALANLFWPCGNQYFQQPLMKKWPYLKKGRIISDTTTITQTIIPALKEWFPKGRYTTTKEGKNYEYKWKTDTGWEFDLMTYNQDLSEFESANLGFAFFDEPPDKPIYIATVARMRQGGLIGIFATPLSDVGAWMYDEIVANADKAKAKYSFFMTATVFDASIAKGIRGFLKTEDIKRMIAQYDDEDKQARIFGRFQHLVGLVFKMWDRKIHVIQPFHMNKKDYVWIEAIDPHPRNPDAVLWAAIDRKGRYFVTDEIYESGRTGDLSERIKEKREGKRIEKFIGDPSMFNVDQHTGRSLSSDLQQYGLHYEKGSKRRMDAVRKIKNALNWKKVGDEWIKVPQVFVFDRCVRLIWEIEHWQWDDWRGRTAVHKSPKEKPKDKDDHEIENLGRILLEDMAFSEYRLDNYHVKEVNTDPYD